MPDALVCEVATLIAPPPDATPQATVTFGTGFAYWSVTLTASGAPVNCATVLDWLLPPEMPMALAAPATIVIALDVADVSPLALATSV
jgi:hypothetical protein